MKSAINKHRKTTKKYVIVSTVIICILLVCSAAYAFTQTISSSSSPKTESNNSSSGSSSTNTQKDDQGKGIAQPSTLPSNSQSITTDDVPVSNVVKANITRLEQTDSTVHFSAEVSGAKELGRCVITFSTPNDRPVTKEFDAVKGSDSYSCDIDISSLEFSYLGNWNVSFRYYTSTEQATSSGVIKIS